MCFPVTTKPTQDYPYLQSSERIPIQILDLQGRLMLEAYSNERVSLVVLPSACYIISGEENGKAFHKYFIRN